MGDGDGDGDGDAVPWWDDGFGSRQRLTVTSGNPKTAASSSTAASMPGSHRSRSLSAVDRGIGAGALGKPLSDGLDTFTVGDVAGEMLAGSAQLGHSPIAIDSARTG